MGHKRKGSPFPLTLRPTTSPSTTTTVTTSADSPCSAAPASTPTFEFQSRSSSPETRISLLSADSDSSDPLANVYKRRTMMSREPAGMVLNENGLPIPLSIAPVPRLPSVTVTVATPTFAEAESAVVEALGDDMETPVQSPTTPTAGRFALAQSKMRAETNSTTVSRSGSLVPSLGLHHRRDRPRQRVPESAVISQLMPLDPFAASDAESLAESAVSEYWSARSSMGSFNESRENVEWK